MTADVSLEFHIESAIEQVWKALTDSDLLRKWIWNNTFKPEEGYGFKFHGPPNEWWDGIVTGEVLEVSEPYDLAYTWSSQGETTTIRWKLKVGENETNVRFEQSGVSEETAYPGALDGARKVGSDLWSS